MRSALLYYHKHHGSLVTWFASAIERYWHTLRLLRNKLRHTHAYAQQKAEESKVLRALLKQAWHDTSGGQSSPQRPW